MTTAILAGAEQHAPLVVAFYVRRALPPVVYACIAPQASATFRAGALLAFFGPLPLAGRFGWFQFDYLFVPLLGLTYFAVAAWITHGLRQLRAHGRIGRLPTLVAVAMLFVAIPATVVSGGQGVVLQILGWEIMFAAYSYCVDTERHERPPTLGACLFFLLVNPTLVYAHRGERIGAPRFSWSGFVRAVGGLATVCVHHAVLITMVLVPILTPAQGFPADFSDYGGTVAYSAAIGIALYAGHSGRASFDVGALRLLGWRIPERFRYPLLSWSPVEFWRRWNLYLGGWARRYIFTPSSHRSARSFRWLPRPVAVVVGVMAAFAAIGLAHDYSLVLRGGLGGGLGGLLVFLIHGLAVVAWVGASRLAGRLAWRPSRSATWALRATSWLVFFHYMVVMTPLTIAALSGAATTPW